MEKSPGESSAKEVAAWLGARLGLARPLFGCVRAWWFADPDDDRVWLIAEADVPHRDTGKAIKVRSDARFPVDGLATWDDVERDAVRMMRDLVARLAEHELLEHLVGSDGERVHDPHAPR